jgi:predicted esterase
MYRCFTFEIERYFRVFGTLLFCVFVEPCRSDELNSVPQKDDFDVEVIAEIPEPDAAKMNFEEFGNALFTEHSFEYTGRGYKNKEFDYFLFEPEDSEEGATRPLLVWLHGYGEGGGRGKHYKCLMYLDLYVLKRPFERSRFPFNVLVVQCPEENREWTTTQDDKDDMINVVAAATDDVLKRHRVDPKRILLVGISDGGTACWELALRRPDLFAAVAPMASDGPGNSSLTRLLGIPVWAFHSTGDMKPPPDGDIRAIAELTDAGSPAHYSGIETDAHDCWCAAFESYDLLNWILQQEKGSATAPKPGVVSWSGDWRAAKFWSRMTWNATYKSVADYWRVVTLWQLVGQIGLPSVTIFAIWSNRRKTRGKLASMSLPANEPGSDLVE